MAKDKFSFYSIRKNRRFAGVHAVKEKPARIPHIVIPAKAGIQQQQQKGRPMAKLGISIFIALLLIQENCELITEDLDGHIVVCALCCRGIDCQASCF